MQQQPRLPLWFLVANWALIAGAFFLGISLAGRRTAELPQAQLDALTIVHRQILRSHVDPQTADALLERAIAGMVKGLDPYSLYVPPADVARYEEANTGHYEGIGAEFAPHGDVVVLHFPLADSPAERAGLRPGDLLLAVDGVALDQATARARVVDLVRGPAGSDVRLRLQRDGSPLEVVVRRGDVQRPCVKWVHRVDGEADLGYLHLTDFHPGAAEQVAAAITSLQAGGPLRGLVLDLRENGGGSLDECVAIARSFVPQGLIVSQQRRDSEVVERHEAKPELCRHATLPLVVLVNKRSASASEVLAGALQDHGRAAIVGVRTHGKGYVNTVYTWQDHAFRLKLTTGKYRTPNGRDIERHHRQQGTSADGGGGIPPDVEVPVGEEVEDRILVTLAASEPPAAYRDAFALVAQKHGAKVHAPPVAANDPQLAAALTALRQRAARDTNGGGESPPAKDK